MNKYIERIKSGDPRLIEDLYAEYGNDSDKAEKIKTIIDGYKQWYDKSQQCVQSAEELRGSLHDLAQKELSNITEHYQTWLDLQKQISDNAAGFVTYANASGVTDNSNFIKGQYDAQISAGNNQLGILTREMAEYSAKIREFQRQSDLGMPVNSDAWGTAIK